MIIGTFRLSFYLYTEDTEIIKMVSLWPRFIAVCVKGRARKNVNEEYWVSAYHVPNTIMGL